MNARWLKVSALGNLLAACTSVSPHFHTLLPALAEGEARPPAEARMVGVEPVRIPAQSDRFELVMRRSDGGITLSENELWIAPLADELKSSLSVEIERQLTSSHAKNASFDSAPLSVRIEVERFESAPSHYAFIEALWQLRASNTRSQVILTCRTDALEHVGKGFAALVRGHQRAVILIADQIAAAARRLDSGEAAICPSP
jgi:uncharacterized lipoprotein YmbA